MFIYILFLVLTASFLCSASEIKKREYTIVSSPLKGYSVSPPQMTGTVNGQSFQIDGTIDEAIAALAKIHPVTNADFANLNNASSSPDTQLAKRNMVLPVLYYPAAGQPWELANWSDAAHIARLLDGMYGNYVEGSRTTLKAKSCAHMVSCVIKIGVWACNDNNYDIEHHNAFLASYIRQIMSSCRYKPGAHLMTGGQVFDT